MLKTLGPPDGVRLLTNRDDVRAVSADGRWIGTSWGLVRYRTLPDKTLEILQIPIGVRVTTFCKTPAGLFVGTRGGLYRLDGPEQEKPSLVRIDLESVKRQRGDTSEHAIYNNELLWWQDALWVRDGDGLFRYDPAKKTARYFGRVPGKLFAASHTLWTGTNVLNPATDEFESIQGEGRYWHLIGATSKEIWADVNVNNELRHRPALVDPKTHALRVLPIESTAAGPSCAT